MTISVLDIGYSGFCTLTQLGNENWLNKLEINPPMANYFGSAKRSGFYLLD